MSEQGRPDDRELDDFVAGRHEMSRRYRQIVERESPPDSLDYAILQQARRALEHDQRAKRRRFVVPLALAATVVLSFSVFVAVRQERADSGNVALTAEQQVEVARPRPFEAQGLPAPAAPPAVGEAAATKSAAAPPSARLRQEADALRKDDAIREAEARKAEQPAMMAAPAAAAPQAAGAAASQFSADRAASTAVEREKSESRPLAKKRSALRDERAASAKFALQRIRTLKEKGDLDDARRELDKFRLLHPDEEIPDDLRPLTRPVTPPTP